MQKKVIKICVCQEKAVHLQAEMCISRKKYIKI